MSTETLPPSTSSEHFADRVLGTAANEMEAIPYDGPTSVSPSSKNKASYTPDKHYKTHGIEVGLGRRVLWNQQLDISYAMREDQEVGDLTREINETRTQLNELPLDAKSEINLLIDHNPQQFSGLRTALGVSPDEDMPDYVDMLTQTKGESDDEKTYVVGNETFLNFLQLHNFLLMRVNEKFTAETRGGLENSFENRVKAAHDEGWMPDSALENLHRVTESEVVIDDGVKTLARAMKGFTSPYYGAVVLGPDALRDPNLLTKLYTHEETHVLEGDDGDMGIITQLFTSKTSSTANIMQEAIVEHTAQALIHGDIDQTNPYKRPGQEDAFYFENRFLLDTLIHSGKQKVDVRLFIKALIDNPEPGETSTPALDDLRSALEKAYPDRDIIGEINALESNEDINAFCRGFGRVPGSKARAGSVMEKYLHWRTKVVEAAGNPSKKQKIGMRVMAGLSAMAAIGGLGHSASVAPEVAPVEQVSIHNSHVPQFPGANSANTDPGVYNQPNTGRTYTFDINDLPEGEDYRPNRPGSNNADSEEEER